MKKFTLLQTILLTLLTLIVGLFIGLFIDYPNTGTDELAGTIGKASKYHNVQVTEDDIQLRNELLEDSTLRNQYERYLTYFYYQAVKTTSDLETVLKNTSSVREFEGYTPVLKKISTYLETARIDILSALSAVQAIGSEQQIPIHAYLNDANNAIARMNSQSTALLFYLDEIDSYLKKNPNLSTPELRDAHDILAINLMTSATIINDKPTLRYLDKRDLANNKERVNQLIADEPFQSTNVQRYINPDTEKLKTGFTDQTSLKNMLSIDFPLIVDQIVVGIIFLLDTHIVGDKEILKTGFTDQSPLQAIIFHDQHCFGSDLLFSQFD